MADIESTRLDSGIVALTLNRPDRMNALGQQLIAEFAGHLAELNRDPEVRILIIKANGRAFCAGADLKERAQMSEPQVAQFVSKLRSTFATLYQHNKITVAMIQGAALGGGLELALACDLRYAANQAKLGLTETRLAIIPGAGGTQLLPRLIGVAKAKEMIYSARVVNGTEAAQTGLVHASVPLAELESFTMQRVNAIAANGPIALAQAKKAIDMGIQGTLEEGLKIEQSCYAEIIPTQDRLEGLQAFREKRPPKYEGH